MATRVAASLPAEEERRQNYPHYDDEPEDNDPHPPRTSRRGWWRCGRGEAAEGLPRLVICEELPGEDADRRSRQVDRDQVGPHHHPVHQPPWQTRRALPPRH